MSLLGNGFTSAVSQHSDPFKKDGLERIMLVWRKGFSSGSPPQIYAKVAFKVGNTEGEHGIEAETMNDLIKKVESFILTLR